MTTHRLFFLAWIAALGLWLPGCAEQTNSTQSAEPTDTAETNADGAEQHAGLERPEPKVDRAIAVIQPVGMSDVRGTVEFVSQDEGVRVTGRISGLTPGEHGFHVHQYGNLTDAEKGQSAGGHFNPTDHPHGAQDADVRHVGDLGNIVANEQGVATIDMADDVIQLSGPNSIIGRALVVHAEADKFTQPSGDAGARVGFGVIGIAGPPQ